jgi:hypothetical protein
MLLVTPEEPPEKRGGLLLTIALLGVIGYAGYRVYAPGMDLWRRAHEAVETRGNQPKPDSTPTAASPDSSNVISEPQQEPQPTQPAETPRSTAFERAVSASSSVTEKSVAKDAAQPKAIPAISGKAPESALTTASSPAAADATQKPAVLPGPSPARLLESKLRNELASEGLARKVTIQAKGQNLTISGSLTPSEHREVLDHLRNVPAGVRIVDDIEYADLGSSSSAATTVGWIWVRSTPPSARILVDGSETGLRTPARLELQAGEHDVQVVRQGFGASHRTVTVDPGKTMQFSETLSNE